MATPATDNVAAPADAAPAQNETVPAPAPADGKTVRCLILDTGALIKNEPSVSTLLAQTHELFTIPAVLAEIRDAETRRRVDTTLRPFLTIRTPKPESIRFITAFARRTGDLEVLSPPDVHLLALTYELECERNGGDGRLRNTPAQKHLNGEKPSSEEKPAEAGAAEQTDEAAPAAEGETEATREMLEKTTLDETKEDAPAPAAEDASAGDAPEEAAEGDESDGDSDDGWITPSNLKKHVAKDQNTNAAAAAPEFLEAALLTTDFAMQNVALRINLHLLSPAMYRITRLRTYCMRCHGCFAITKDMTKQFCHKCGQPTLIRTSCSVDEDGSFQVHLRSNFQYIKRGNVYSIPKPAHGTSSGKKAKVQGGGKNGWGHNLVLAEDQKEYVRAQGERRRARQRDLMDEDYLPSILTGERKGGDERIRVGAGRGVNNARRKKT